MPLALLFFISVRVFLTSDAVIGGTSDVSRPVLFCEGCMSLSLELYSFASVHRSLVVHICLFEPSVCLFFISHIFCFGPPLFFRFGLTLV